MSGQPNIKPTDQAKFREQYLANLDLRARLDDMNLQANKVYKRTGQLPVEPSDFRTTEEKLADIERLKREVRGKLSEIADGREANKISQELTPKQLLFYSQSADTINAEIKKKYRMGVYAEIFIPYLQRYMNNTANVNGINTGLQQSSGANAMLSVRAIRDLLPTPNEVKSMVELVSQSILGKRNKDLRDVMSFKSSGLSFERVADELARTLGGISQAGVMIDTFTSGRSTTKEVDEDDINTAIKLLNDVAGELITKVEMFRWAESFKRSTGTRDAQQVGAVLERGVNLFQVPPETTRLLSEVFKLVSPILIRPGSSAGGEKAQPGRSGSEKVYPDDILNGENIDDMIKFNTASLLNYANDLGIPLTTKQKRSKNALMNAIRDATMSGVELRGDIEGTGLSRPKAKPIRHKKPTNDEMSWFGGVAPTKKFVPIGRYIINQHRLNDDIIAVKRPSGSSIKELPSEKVSRKLGHIVRTIVGGAIPDFEDLEGLDDIEKAYINKLAGLTHIKDRLTLPAPRKSDMDKEMDEFEIMKGEIMSGNDNKDLVKKFKVKLMKLMKLNLIPKGQAKELLLELTELGF